MLTCVYVTTCSAEKPSIFITNRSAQDTLDPATLNKPQTDPIATARLQYILADDLKEIKMV